MRILVGLLSTAALVACNSPPKPPTVSGTDRTTANSSETASSLVLCVELAESKSRVRELENRPVPSAALAPVALPRPSSEVVTFHYPFNVTRFQPTMAQETALLPLLSNFRRIEVRGRTDGPRPSAGDERVAFLRAQSAMNYLVAQGVPATKVTVNYVSGSDHIGINDTAIGRAQNRRVEIEVFKQ